PKKRSWNLRQPVQASAHDEASGVPSHSGVQRNPSSDTASKKSKHIVPSGQSSNCVDTFLSHASPTPFGSASMSAQTAFHSPSSRYGLHFCPWGQVSSHGSQSTGGGKSGIDTKVPV